MISFSYFCGLIGLSESQAKKFARWAGVTNWALAIHIEEWRRLYVRWLSENGGEIVENPQ